jgi:ribosomal protein L44E
MSFDAFNFYRDYNVPYITEGTKHCQEGWIQTVCPFCTGNPGHHLGFDIQGNFYNCWRCGWHSTEEVIQALAGVSFKEAKDIKREYKLRASDKSKLYSKQDKPKGKFKLPYGCGPLQKQHKRYLEKRLFDPDKIESLYGIMGTGPLGKYNYRIIAPIFFNERLVSYQGRDITDKSDMKYKACPKDVEIIFHKHLVYAIDLVPGDSGVVVEGITDVWRLGPGAVATFGIKFTNSQIKLLASRFKRLFFFYDPGDPQAIVQAEKLAYAVAALGDVECEIIGTSDSDPGSMSDEDAAYLMKHLSI